MFLKNVILIGLTLSSAGLTQAMTTESVGAKEVFVIDGFDSNDITTVFVEGELSNTCLQLTTPIVTVDEQRMRIDIDIRAYRNTGNCIPARISFDQNITIGELKAGSWSIAIGGSNQGYAINIAQADTTSTDDFLYASIESIAVEKDTATGQLTAVITGQMFASCLAWDEVKVIDQAKVVVLLPILKQTSSDCQPSGESFQKRIALPRDRSEGRHLLHVRSLNGQAFNQLFSVQN
jgi:hypothetical protein